MSYYTDDDTTEMDRPWAGSRRMPSETPPWYVAVVAVILIAILALLVVIVIRSNGDGDQNVDAVLPTTSTPASTSGPTTTSTSETTTSTSQPTSTAAQSTSESSTTVSSTTGSTSTSTTSTTTTTQQTTSTTEPTTTSVDPSLFETAVWPWFDSATRYTDPTAAALGFAEDFVGFENPIVGPFMQGDSQSGEVEVRSVANGPVTVVFVRKLGPNQTWWVLGSATANIVLDDPDTGAQVTTPLALAGQAVAFEGTVDIELRADGQSTPLAAGFVTGGGTEMAPFEGTFPFEAPASDGGAVVLKTLSAEDGSVNEAAVRRIRFS